MSDVARVILEGKCCICCAVVIVNGDDSGCRDYWGHTHPAPTISGDLERQANEIWGEVSEIPWAAWLVISGDEPEEIVGPCELCREGDGYMVGHTFSLVR